ncbi:MAG: hypothetical protein ACKO5F_15625 [Synechococcus sp.]
MRTLRDLAVEASNAILGIVLVVLLLQGQELSGASDLCPAASLVVLLTLRSIAIGWARLHSPSARMPTSGAASTPAWM